MRPAPPRKHVEIKMRTFTDKPETIDRPPKKTKDDRANVKLQSDENFKMTEHSVVAGIV